MPDNIPFPTIAVSTYIDSHLTSLKALTTACLLLLSVHAVAAEPASCRVSSKADAFGLHKAFLTTDGDQSTLPPGAIEMDAGRMEASVADTPGLTLSKGVRLRSGDKLASADNAHFDDSEKSLRLDGNVQYQDPSTIVTGSSAQFSYQEGRIRFEGAEFSMGNDGRGAADGFEINENGKITLEHVEYTTCPPGSEDWLMQGASIEMDTEAGVGTARGMKLRFKGVPILYAPYLSFPIGDARKSGVLTPEIGSGGRNGYEVRVPYYWNIAPNYDATITPRLLTDRGLQLETLFRYLTPRHDGSVTGDFLYNDDRTGASRHQIRVAHRSLFDNGWRGQVDFREVSDSQYYEDLGGSLSISSITHLNRSISFDYASDNFIVFGQVQDYQTIDDAIDISLQPYQRLPQLLFNGKWSLPAGLQMGIDSELVNFDREVGTTGWRANVAPTLELPITRPGWFVTPAVSLDYTHYDLSNVIGGDDTPERSVPISSLDSGMILERTMRDSSRVQTLEPRILYVNIPFRDQENYPVFDTITPDINLVQLYRKNRFLGIDRIGDTEQLSVGVTSRVLELSTGRELMSATVGQTRYYEDRMVTLPGALAETTKSSDYIAQLRFSLFRNVNFDLGQQWSRGQDSTVKSEARLQYRPKDNRILNLAYRFRRDSLEQGDLSWSWPLATRWNFVGRYNFSFRDDKVLEQFFGLEYESCCWGLRMVSRRHISTRDGTRDSSFGLQLVLKGMMSVGTAADKLLERGILGYSADLR